MYDPAAPYKDQNLPKATESFIKAEPYICSAVTRPDGCGWQGPCKPLVSILVHARRRCKVLLRNELLLDRTKKSCSCFEPAREGFNKAKKVFSNSLRSDQQQQIFGHDSNNIEEFRAIVNQAKEGYERRRQKGKARQWLSSFSSRLLYYGAVLDTLSQHHPEYVSLAWGAVKFVFIVGMRTVNNFHTTHIS